MFESSWLSALCTHTPSLPFERALPSNVPLRATLCGISSRERKKEKDERERERTLYESQEHRPPASRNLRRDCCAPRAHRVPEALSLVRGHRKSPEDDQLTEDPLPSNSSCRRPPYFVLCSLSLLPPPSPPLSLSPPASETSPFYTDLTIFQRARSSTRMDATMFASPRFLASDRIQMQRKYIIRCIHIGHEATVFVRYVYHYRYFRYLVLYFVEGRKVSPAFLDFFSRVTKREVTRDLIADLKLIPG